MSVTDQDGERDWQRGIRMVRRQEGHIVHLIRVSKTQKGLWFGGLEIGDLPSIPMNGQQSDVLTKDLLDTRLYKSV